MPRRRGADGLIATRPSSCLVRLVAAFGALDQGRQAEHARPQPPFGLDVAVVAGLGERHAEVGVGVDEADLVGEAVVARVEDAQRDAAIGAGRHGDAHGHAADDAIDGDLVAVETHEAPPSVGARVGRGEAAGFEGDVFGRGLH